jgi:hypothetical protein
MVYWCEESWDALGDSREHDDRGVEAMVDPRMFPQLTEVLHQDRVQKYAHCYEPHAEQTTTPQSRVPRQVQGAWRALLARLSPAPGH